MFTIDFVNDILVPAIIRFLADVLEKVLLQIDWLRLLETILQMLGM